ncbi:MAG TPA: 16S rRNA (cytidine(1402)-2'-O)-methyltransferase [Candidatus Saccharimonadales bacterium]|nr:16S rRNA (cytidine(1402)-2'-O)-methyltransferase [Candidatus Saccharimonadales bacterium]
MPATQPSLYLVGTPIGNLEDISLRALRILKEVDLIACEDTRQTSKLLNHYGIETRTISYHEHNELTRSAELIMHLEQGQSIAVVTDAGMPGVSDPGYRLAVLAIRHKIPVVPIPGASAFLSALVASGLPTDSFVFHGFLPAKLGQRRKFLEEIQHSPRTQIFYEAPHRLVATLEDIAEVLGPHRHVVVAREVTKIYEEFVRATAAEVLEDFKKRDEVRGEITLLIAKAEEQHGLPAVTQKNARTRVRELMKSGEIDEKEAMKRVAKEMGISKSDVYRELQKDGKK